MHRLLLRFLTALAALAALSSVAGAAMVQETQGRSLPTTREIEPQDVAAVSDFRPTVKVVENSQNISKAPATVAELLDLESRIRTVVEQVLPATVSLVITRDRNQFQGSGVIISPDGYVLTAAHVAERPGNRVTVVMSDGTRYEGVSLGLNRSLDDGLVKITDPDAGDLPWAPLGSADELPLGTWTIAMGHPGGYQQDRPPVVRVGRILAKGKEYVLTDNTLVGGDSGGPLFDLDGRVIGIHSRIEQGIVSNVHVPSDRFMDDWGDLVQSKQWGGMLPEWMRRGPAADDGLRFDQEDDGKPGARVARVFSGGPGDRAGIRMHDRVIAIDDKPVNNGQDVMLRRAGLRPGQSASYTILRGDETLKIELTPISPDELRRPNPRNDPDRPVMGITMDEGFLAPGVRLEAIPPGGPAEKAGLQAGDVILSYNGQLLRNPSELGELMGFTSEVGDQVTLRIRRGSQELTVQLQLAAFRHVYPERLRR